MIYNQVAIEHRPLECYVLRETLHFVGPTDAARDSLSMVKHCCILAAACRNLPSGYSSNTRVHAYVR